MWSAATVVLCALDLLGRSAASFPPITIVDVRPADVSARAEAFVRIGEDRIYLLSSSPALQQARQAEYRCGALPAVRKLASVLVHEEWHVRNGPDERGAYQAQLMALATLNAGPESAIYRGVVRSMREALARPPQAAPPAPGD